MATRWRVGSNAVLASLVRARSALLTLGALQTGVEQLPSIHDAYDAAVKKWRDEKFIYGDPNTPSTNHALTTADMNKLLYITAKGNLWLKDDDAAGKVLREVCWGPSPPTFPVGSLQNFLPIQSVSATGLVQLGGLAGCTFSSPMLYLSPRPHGEYGILGP